jgi:hypothetical protein
MVIEQMVELPASNRLVLEVPYVIPAGRVRVTFTPEPEIVVKDKSVAPLLALQGYCKGLDTTETYFERKRADKKAMEDAQIERNRNAACLIGCIHRIEYADTLLKKLYASRITILHEIFRNIA